MSNNAEYIKENLSNETIAEYIHKKYCENGDCGVCPLRSECEEIYEVMNKDAKPIDRILF